MISDNTVDLTGFVYNLLCRDYGNFTNIYFTLNVPNRFRNKEGRYVTEYDTIACVISSNKDADGNHRKSFNFFDKNLIEGQLLRVQGRISTWNEALVDGELVTLTNENKKEAKKIIPKTIIRIANYRLLEKKEVAVERLNKRNNSSIHKKKIEEAEKVEETEREEIQMDSSKETQSLHVEQKSEAVQGEVVQEELDIYSPFTSFYPEAEFPEYEHLQM